MAITTREGLLRVRGGMVQFRKVDGKFWRDLVHVDTLLELDGGLPGGGTPTDPPVAVEGFPFAQAMTPDGRDLVGLDKWRNISNGNAVPTVAGGELRLHVTENYGGYARLARAAATDLRVQATVNGDVLFFLRSTTALDGILVRVTVDPDNGVYTTVRVGSANYNYFGQPQDANGYALVDLTLRGQVLTVNGSDIPFPDEFTGPDFIVGGGGSPGGPAGLLRLELTAPGEAPVVDNDFSTFSLAQTTKTVATEDGWNLLGSTEMTRYLPTSMSIRDLSGSTQATVTRDLGGNLGSVSVNRDPNIPADYVVYIIREDGSDGIGVFTDGYTIMRFGNTVGRGNYNGEPITFTFGADRWTIRNGASLWFDEPPLWTPKPGEKYYLQLAEISPTSDGTWLGVVEVAPPS